MRLAGTAFWIACALAAFASALPFAGGWNDGSRLAAIEAIADHGTLAIDDSIFVRVPQDTVTRGVPPYPDSSNQASGTLDKLLIDGHFYSDKPALISILMAGVVWVWELLGGPSAALRPDLFCLLLTWSFSALPYLVGVVCVYRIGRRLDLSPNISLLLSASFAFGTVSLIYTRHVNNHIMLLGVMSALTLQMLAFAQESSAGVIRSTRLVLMGVLGGLGYVLDLGLGPVLIACLSLLVLVRCRSLRGCAWYLAGVMPWLAAHHVLNYAMGGTFKPMNSVPEYSAYEGCPFDPSNMTGFLRLNVHSLLVYPLSLLHGKHGFLGHNLPMLLAPWASWVAWKRLPRYRPEIAFAAAWCIGGWLMYGLLSNNYGGMCRSIRWFVPFLAPGFFVIALLLREKPGIVWDFGLFTVAGIVLSTLLWQFGPWSNKIGLFYWPIQAAALLGWGLLALFRSPEKSRESRGLEQETRLELAA